MGHVVDLFDERFEFDDSELRRIAQLVLWALYVFPTNLAALQNSADRDAFLISSGVVIEACNLLLDHLTDLAPHIYPLMNDGDCMTTGVFCQDSGLRVTARITFRRDRLFISNVAFDALWPANDYELAALVA